MALPGLPGVGDAKPVETSPLHADVPGGRRNHSSVSCVRWFLVVVFVLASGCSWATVQAPGTVPAGECTRSRAAPVADGVGGVALAVLAGLSAPWVFAATQVEGADTVQLVAVPVVATGGAAVLLASAKHGSNAVRRCRDGMEAWERPGGRGGAGVESELDAYSSEKIRSDYARGRELREAREGTTGTEPESEPESEPEPVTESESGSGTESESESGSEPESTPPQMRREP